MKLDLTICPVCMDVQDLPEGAVKGRPITLDTNPVTCGNCGRANLYYLLNYSVTPEQISASIARSKKETIDINRRNGGRKAAQTRRENGEDNRYYGTKLAVGFMMMNG
ncbi:MAG: hypothetical protein ACTSW4_00940 [Candidatus Ranarchaeia archaeon]